MVFERADPDSRAARRLPPAILPLPPGCARSSPRIRAGVTCRCRCPRSVGSAVFAFPRSRRRSADRLRKSGRKWLPVEGSNLSLKIQNLASCQLDERATAPSLSDREEFAGSTAAHSSSGSSGIPCPAAPEGGPIRRPFDAGNPFRFHRGQPCKIGEDDEVRTRDIPLDRRTLYH